MAPIGTCLRLLGVAAVTAGTGTDRTAHQVWRELRISLRTSETKGLVAWFDRGTTGKLRSSDLCDAVFGRRPSRESTADHRQRQEQRRLPPPPRKPHVLQAQRAAALAMGESSASGASGVGGYPVRLPAPGGARERRRRAANKRDDRIAWNWQGRASAAAAPAAAAAGEGHRQERVENVSGIAAGSKPRGGGAGLLRASGEAVVAEKARIERRLRELQQERASLLREKRGVECWAETAGAGADPPRLLAKCAA